MAQKNADAFRDLIGKEVFELACAFLGGLDGHVEDVMEKTLGEAMASYNLTGFLFSLIGKQEPVTFDIYESFAADRLDKLIVEDHLRYFLDLVDVDDFKQYNDLHGHLAGDEALVGLAVCLREACRREVDVPFRYGGDEFVVILPEADREIASEVARRIGALFRDKGLDLSLSIGVNDLTAGRDLKEIIRDADQAMYKAKQSGGNRAVAFESPF
jgi:diguanylate cyclase (GGDEF)-like protein